MHLGVPLETQKVLKVDLNWTCLLCSYGMEWYVCKPARFLIHFSVPDLDFYPILDLLAGFVSIPLCEYNLSPTGLV